ncbi:MAG: Dabb family protein [Opitutaceae bacterium]|nr:Dabb family protein [Opitutaceae bacterium]
MKKLIRLLLIATLLPAAAFMADAAKSTKNPAPKSVIHVVTVAWKKDATEAQIKAALDGVRALPASFPGITRVWTRSIKVQNAAGTTLPRTHAFVMEFANEAALKAYADSDAQKEWYKVYTSIRESSTTHDITN